MYPVIIKFSPVRYLIVIDTATELFLTGRLNFSGLSSRALPVKEDCIEPKWQGQLAKN